MRSLSLFVLAAVLGVAAHADGVTGKVTFDGKAPKGMPIKMNADPKCLEQHKAGFDFAPVQVGGNGGLANVFVYVKKGVEGKSFTAPADAKVILDQKGCWYYPHVSGIMVGQTLEIVNDDPVMHNVNAQPEFNAAMPPTVKKMDKTFKKEKVMFKLKCNVHPWMTSYVGILPHPYYAVTDKDGSFDIKGLPAGKYTIEAWHETLGSMTQEITVGATGGKADFKFASKAKAKS